MDELLEEGKDAIDSPGSPTQPDLPPQDYILGEMKNIHFCSSFIYCDFIPLFRLTIKGCCFHITTLKNYLFTIR